MADETKLEEITVTAKKRESKPEPKSFKNISDRMDSSRGTKFSSNIDKLKYNFDTGARSNRFHVNLHCPKLNLSLDGLRCETASLPGRSLGTTEFSPYGAEESFPDGTINNGGTIDLTFLCDSGFYDRFIIETWQSMIYASGSQTLTTSHDVINPDTNELEKEERTEEISHGNSLRPYFAYKDDYTGEIEIHQFRLDDKTALRYRLYDAWPVSYADMDLSSTAAEPLMKFSCTFAYTTFDTEYVEKPPLSALNKGRRMLDILLGGLKVGSRFSGKAGRAMNKLQKLDTAVSRGAAIFGNRGG